MKIKLAFPLSGSALRPLRLIVEHKKEIEKALDNNVELYIHINDINNKAVETAKKNFDNEIVRKLEDSGKLHVLFHNLDAQEFMHKERHFDYIELDPFGSPNEFLDTALRCLKDKGILSVTATDTAALTGTYPKTTVWKYWSTAVRMPTMHELSLRILARKVMMHASPYAKAAVPLLSYYNLHYIKSFFRVKKSKKQSYDLMLKMKKVSCMRKSGILLGYEGNAIDDNVKIDDEKVSVGPLFSGQLTDNSYLSELHGIMDSAENHDAFSKKLRLDFQLMLKESLLNENAYYFDVHELSSLMQKNRVEKSSVIIERIRERGFNASRSIFGDNLIRTDIALSELLKIF